MNTTRKTLTTLGIAAAMALGGIAVAQTAGTTDSSTGTMGSSATVNNSGTADLGATAGSTTTTTTTTDTTMNNATTTTDTDTGRVAQMDRN